jgi:hypothetical protein
MKRRFLLVILCAVCLTARGGITIWGGPEAGTPVDIVSSIEFLLVHGAGVSLNGGDPNINLPASLSFANSTVNGSLAVTNTTVVTSISFPNLTALNDLGSLVVTGATVLTSINLGNLTSIGSGPGSSAGLSYESNPSLSTFSLPSLTTIGGNSYVIVHYCALTSFSVAGLASLGDGVYILLDNNALDQASVDAILVKLATFAATGGTLQLDGGTNAAPSAPGLAAKATLEAQGWTVTTN